MTLDAACREPQTATGTGICPASGTKGQPVGFRTVAALTSGPLPPHQDFWLCRETGCEIVYFGSEGATLTSANLHVEPGFKHEGDGALCYCFGHRRSDFERETLATGATQIPSAIKELTRAGGCACEVRNPSGRCCLGEVKRYVDELLLDS